MKNKRNTRIGEIRTNKQGLTMKIVKYLNNKNVTIEFVETGERKVVRYTQFAAGVPRADLLAYPPNGDCSIKQASFFSLAILTLALVGVLGAIIYYFCK